MTSTLISLISGSLSGIIGHWFKAREDRNKREFELRKQELQMKQDEQRHQHALAEIEASVKVASVQAENELMITEAKDFNRVVADMNKSLLSSSVLNTLLDGGWGARFFGVLLAFLLGLVDVVRGLIRPMLTGAAFTAIGLLAVDFAGDLTLLTPDQRSELMILLLDAVIYVLTAATQFWFMDRQGARAFRQKHS